MKKIIKLLVLFGGVLFLQSCEDILEPEQQGAINVDALFSNEENAITAINGVYNNLHSIYGYSLLALTDTASDDGWTWRADPLMDLFRVEENYAHTLSLWKNSYVGINRANVVIDGVGKVPSWTNDDMPKLIEGQAKFLRGLFYFNLVRLFGGVPLIDKVNENAVDAELPRSSVQEVYALIKSDLTDAIAWLPTAYAGGNGKEVGRATKYSAQILLAYVHLELEEWAESASLSTVVIGNGGALLDDYADNFNGSHENGSGSLFELQNASPGTGSSSFFNQTNAPTAFLGAAEPLPTDDNLNGTANGPGFVNGLVQAFEPNDLRKDVTLATYDLENALDATQPVGSLYYVNKYYNAGVVISESPWNIPLLRYADALLVAAEALNEKSYIADGPAFGYLNEIRNNAGLGTLTSADLPDQASFRNAVRQERRVEFTFEFKRYFDLNRWGILASTIQPQLTPVGATFPTGRTSSHPITGKNYYLYPLPGVEFLNNPSLGEQNPGYN